MFELFLALFLAFSCPAQNGQNGNGTVSTQGSDTGGDGSHIPVPPPPPPPRG